MLTRNCEFNIGDFIEIGDYNARFTVVEKQKIKSNGYWIETIRDSLGGGVMSEKKQALIHLKFQKSGQPIEEKNLGGLWGNKIISSIEKIVAEVDIVRIDIINSPVSFNRKHTWIIARV